MDATPFQKEHCHRNNVNTAAIVPSGDPSLDILRAIFKFENFRGLQKQAIDSILQRKNTLLVMPTGGGKTICYAVPTLLQEKVTVVVFPLLSLLIDQCQRFRSKGIPVCYVMSEMDVQERETALHKLSSSPLEYKFLFVTPETLLSNETLSPLQDLAEKQLINFIVIDEAHCIDSWGFNFRPSYRELWKLKVFGVPIIAMTGKME